MPGDGESRVVAVDVGDRPTVVVCCTGPCGEAVDDCGGVAGGVGGGVGGVGFGDGGAVGFGVGGGVGAKVGAEVGCGVGGGVGGGIVGAGAQVGQDNRRGSLFLKESLHADDIVLPPTQQRESTFSRAPIVQVVSGRVPFESPNWLLQVMLAALRLSREIRLNDRMIAHSVSFIVSVAALAPNAFDKSMPEM